MFILLFNPNFNLTGLNVGATLPVDKTASEKFQNYGSGLGYGSNLIEALVRQKLAPSQIAVNDATTFRKNYLTNTSINENNAKRIQNLLWATELANSVDQEPDTLATAKVLGNFIENNPHIAEYATDDILKLTGGFFDAKKKQSDSNVANSTEKDRIQHARLKNEKLQSEINDNGDSSGFLNAPVNTAPRTKREAKIQAEIDATNRRNTSTSQASKGKSVTPKALTDAAAYLEGNSSAYKALKRELRLTDDVTQRKLQNTLDKANNIYLEILKIKDLKAREAAMDKLNAQLLDTYQSIPQE